MDYLKSVRILNAQSLKDVTYEFSKGLNVIIADNETGKSVLGKILKVMCAPNYQGAETRKFIIRDDCESAQVIWTFTSGKVVLFECKRKSQTYYYSENGSTFEEYVQDYIPEKIARLFDFNIAPDNIVANIIDLDQSSLFITASPRANYSLLSLVTSDPKLEEININVKDKIKTIRSQRNKIEDRLNMFTERSNRIQYKNVEFIERDIEEYENVLNLYRELLPWVGTSNELFTSPNEEESNKLKDLCSMYEFYDELNSFVEVTSNLTKYVPLRKDLESNLDLFNLLLDFTEDYKKLPTNDFKSVSIEKKEFVDSSVQLFNITVSLLNSIGDITQKINEIKELDKVIDTTKTRIVKYEEDYKVCPACGKSFKENHSHE